MGLSPVFDLYGMVFAMPPGGKCHLRMVARTNLNNFWLPEHSQFAAHGLRTGRYPARWVMLVAQYFLWENFP
jgi:hypothetical protein